jgi:CHAT domain-containing protein
MEVNDAATAELMRRSYAAMLGARKLPPSADWQDPYYWAAFEIQGDWK